MLAFITSNFFIPILFFACFGFVAFTLIIIILWKQRSLSRETSTSSRYKALVEEYGLSPSSSRLNISLSGFLMITIFIVYAVFQAADVQYGYSHPSTTIEVQHFQELQLPSVRVCAVKNSNYTSYGCFYLPNASQNGYDLNCTAQVLQTPHFTCWTFDYPPITVQDQFVQSQVAFRLEMNYTIYQNPIYGVSVFMVMPNDTDSVNFDPETSQTGFYVSANQMTQVLLSYSKRVSLNGTGQDTPIISTSISSAMCCNENLMFFGISLQSFDVVTVSEIVLITWRQYAAILVGMMGTFYSVYLAVSSFLAKKAKAFKRIIEDNEELTEQLIQ